MTGDTPWVEDREDGCVVRVRAAPGKSRERLVGRHGDALKIAVAAPPEKGRANERLCAVLARLLDLPPRAVTVVGGSTSRDKRLHVHGLDAAEVRARLAPLLSDAR